MVGKNEVLVTYAATRAVELPANVTLPTAMATAHAEALRTKTEPGQEVLGVAIIAGGRRLEIGAGKLAEWGVLPDA